MNANDRITFFNGTNRILATITNLKPSYFNDEVVRLRVYAEDRDRPIKALKLPYYNPSNIYKQMYYQIIDFESKEVIIPFDDTFTKLSADERGMYFNLYMKGLQPERYYRLLFKHKDSEGTVIYDENYYFKVIR